MSDADTATVRRETVRELLEEHPVLMTGDVADELDVSTTTARRYLNDLEAENPAVQCRDSSGGRVWYLRQTAADGGVARFSEVEYHFRNLWTDCLPGRGLLVGLGLTLVVMVLSTISVSADAAGAQQLHERTKSVVQVVSVVCWVLLIVPGLLLWREGELRP